MARQSKKKMLVAASIAGLLSVSAVAAATNAFAEAAPCYGINACKGVGDCGGKGNSCAGKNACKGMGFLKVETDLCTKISGGSLEPAAA